MNDRVRPEPPCPAAPVRGRGRWRGARGMFGRRQQDRRRRPEGRRPQADLAGPQGIGVKPLATPSKLKEAPMLAEQVKAGKLPRSRSGCRSNPYVVPHNWLEPGQVRRQSAADHLPPRDSTASMQGVHVRPLACCGGSTTAWTSARAWSRAGSPTPTPVEWTLHFRKGLKWSDGQPWTTDGHHVLVEGHGPQHRAHRGARRTRRGRARAPSMTDDRAGRTAPSSMKFDAPAPLTADRLAMWVNRGNGPGWMEPKHYLKQFHPKYNKSVGKDWATADGEFEQKRDWSPQPRLPDHDRLEAASPTRKAAESSGSATPTTGASTGRQPASLRRHAHVSTSSRTSEVAQAADPAGQARLPVHGGVHRRVPQRHLRRSSRRRSASWTSDPLGRRSTAPGRCSSSTTTTTSRRCAS